MYAASSWFLRDVEQHNAPIMRRFLLGTSDYSAQVIKYPSLSKTWGDLRPQTVTIELSNAKQLFNYLMTDPLQMRTQGELQLGLSYSGNPAKGFVGLVNSGTAQAAATTSLTLPAGASTTKDYYRDMTVRITSGAGSVQERKVLGSAVNLVSESDNLGLWSFSGAAQNANVDYGPLGTLVMDELYESAATVGHYTYRLITGLSVGVNSLAVCAKQGIGTRYFGLRPYGIGGGKAYAVFDLVNGVLLGSSGTELVSASIEPLGGGIYWCTLTMNNAVAPLGPTMYLSTSIAEVPTYTGDGASSIKVCGMQWQPHAPTALITSGSTVPAVGLIVDKLSSNQCPYSEVLSNAAWTKEGTSLVTGAVTAPDGSLADKLIESATTAVHRLYHNTPIPAGARGAASIYVKAAEVDACSFYIYATGAKRATVRFNLSSGTIEYESGGVGKMEMAEDGWWRISATQNSADTAAGQYWRFYLKTTDAYTGDGVSGLYVWHPQFEVGSVSEYIPVVGTAYVALPDATSVYEVIDSEMVPMFYGTIDAVKYLNNGRVALTLVDKFRELSKRKIGDTTSPIDYSGSSHLIHDLAWYACTSLAGLSAVASTSNTDLDYASFSSWSAVFSADNVRGSARFTGQQPLEILRQIAKLTQSAVYIESGRIKFNRFTLADSAQFLLAAEDIIEASAIMDERQLVNKQWVSAGYDVNSKSFAITVFDIASASVSSYGLREQLVADEFLWLSDSASALNLAQRMVGLNSEITPRFTIKTPLCFVLTTIGDTVLYQDELLEVDAPYRVMGETIDMDAGTKTFEIDATQIFGTFRLDISALDGADVLL